MTKEVTGELRIKYIRREDMSPARLAAWEKVTARLVELVLADMAKEETEPAATPPALDERAYSRALRRHKPVTNEPD